MIQTNAFNEPHPTRVTSLCPTPSFMMSVVVAVLAPIFLGVTGGDADLARMAAAEAINDLRVRNNMDLIAVAQIITNGLAGADSLCRSMGDDMSLSMTLRLRCNAIGLNRASEQNRRVLREKRDTGPVLLYPASVPESELPVLVAEDDRQPEHDGPQVSSGLLMNDMAVQLLAAEAEARLLQPVERASASMPVERVAPVTTKPAGKTSFRRMRARAMLQEAGDLTASLHTLAPAKRRDAEVRIAALGSRVREMLTGGPPAEAMDDPDRDDAVAGDPGSIPLPAADAARLSPP